MDINNFEFNHRQVNRQTFETIITDKESKNKFGCNYNSNAPAPNHVIFNEFQKNHKQFFIEVDAEIIKDEIKSEVIVAPVEKVENVVNSEI